MMSWLELRNERELQDLSRPNVLKLRKFLKGVVVRITVTPKARPKPISDIVPEAGLQEFDDSHGHRITVQVCRQVASFDKLLTLVWRSATF